MAGVDLGAGRPAKKAKGGLKRPKHRVNIRIDMTPMVDIAFLLLIFYMVTTIFSAPLSMEIALPPKTVEGPPSDSLQVAASRLLQIFVNKNDDMYYKIGAMWQPERINPTELERLIDERNRTIDRMVMVLKIDRAASYKMMVNIINMIQEVERSINVERNQARMAAASDIPRFSSRFSIQDMTVWDEHILEVVGSGGTVEE